MLHQAEMTARRYSGQGSLWQHPYANPQPRAASALASVWFTAYPASFMTRPGDSVLHGLGDPRALEPLPGNRASRRCIRGP